ncbi:MAG: hypothetical protein Tsb0019_34460 [Roseibium sp.]
MRFLIAAVLCIISSFPSAGQENPKLDEILNGFSVQMPRTAQGPLSNGTGTIQGRSFTFAHDPVSEDAPFKFRISPLDLPEEDAFFAVVLINDILCVQVDKRPALVSRDFDISLDQSARVYELKCSDSPRQFD